MGWTEVPNKASGDVFTEAMWDTYIKDNLNTGVAVQLDTFTTPDATYAQVDLSNISQSFAHLRVLCHLRGTYAGTGLSLRMRFNDDTTGPYDRQVQFANNATITAGETLGGTFMYAGYVSGSTAPANNFSPHIIDIMDYSAADKNKSMVVQYAQKAVASSGGLQISAMSGFWRSNAAITKLNFYLDSGNWATGSVFSLYGMP